MKFFSILLISIFLISCKKEVPKKNVIPKPIVVETSRKTDEGKIIKIDTTIIKKYKSNLLSELYSTFKNETIWQSTSNRNTFLVSLKNADDEGLNPNDYNVTKLYNYEKKINNLSNNQLVEYDLMLSNSFQNYIAHLYNGKINPKSLYKDWDLKANKIDINALLINSLEKDSLAINLERSKPNHIVYKKLKKALLIINKFPIDTLKKIDFKEKIVLNDTNNTIIKIKKKLIYWKDLAPVTILNAIYDKSTFEGVKIFQKRHGIIADGIIGKGTVAALNYSKTQRKQQIIANLERWRWYSKNMGAHYLIINIPDFRLSVVKNNDTVATHKVIVGSPKRKTPILNSKLSYCAFNPTWTVPPTIIKEDIIPATSRNRNYLAEKNITVYDGNGNVVSAKNWQIAKAKNYRYVQSPGSYNSLGMVKLMFPNNYSVYLHDTNHRDYFDKTNRSLSSGCVRVQNVLKLAEYLIDDKEKYSEEAITAILKTEKTTNVTIKDRIYLQQLYWTAWSENNKLIFRNDIYNLDANLYLNLRK